MLPGALLFVLQSRVEEADENNKEVFLRIKSLYTNFWDLFVGKDFRGRRGFFVTVNTTELLDSYTEERAG